MLSNSPKGGPRGASQGVRGSGGEARALSSAPLQLQAEHPVPVSGQARGVSRQRAWEGLSLPARRLLALLGTAGAPLALCAFQALGFIRCELQRASPNVQARSCLFLRQLLTSEYSQLFFLLK